MSTGYLMTPHVPSSLIEAVGVNADDELIVRLWTHPDHQYRYESLGGGSVARIANAESPGRAYNVLCNLRTAIKEPRVPALQPA